MSALKTLFACILLIAVGTVIHAQEHEWSWAKQAGGTNIEESMQIAVDGDGNSYVVGYYKGSAVFGTTTLTNTTTFTDVFVAKMDANSNWLWAKRAGGTGTTSNTNGDDMGHAITIDSSGNGIYIAGNFNSSVMYFPGSSLSLTRGGSNKDAFVAKIDADGNWVWARKAGGLNTDTAQAIASYGSSHIYLTGSFESTATFGTTSLTTTGGTDIFVSKLDTNGTWIWTVKAGGVSADQGNGIALDSNANIYLTGGYLSATATFGSYSLALSGSSDVFVAKLNNSGTWQWARKGGGTGYDSGFAIAMDSNNNAYITGMKEGSATFGSTVLTTFGSFDVFVAKMDSQGSWQWANRAGGTLSEVAWNLCVDSNSNVYVTGDFTGTAAFGDFNITSSGTSATDGFFAQMDGDGNWLAADRVGNTAGDSGRGLAIGPDRSIYWFGEFTVTVSIGPTSLTSSGSNQDLFVAKLTLRDDNTPVELSSFTAVYTSENYVQLSWVTQSESGMSGFYVYRADANLLCNAQIVSPLIPATNSSQEHSYQFTDNDLCESGTYYYWLQSAEMDGGGVYYGSVSVYYSNTASDPVPEIPLVTELKAVYPNPFNPTAFIPYSIANQADVSIKIYNSRGQLMRNFALGTKLPGNYQITWDGRDASGSACGNGIYYIIMNSGKDRLQRKVGLLK